MEPRSDALAVMINTLPAHVVRFAELYLAGADAESAAGQVGHVGQARALLADQRTLRYLSARCGHATDSSGLRSIRAAAVGMLARMAQMDVTSAFGPTGMLQVQDWPPELRMCVEGLELHESGVVKKVKLTSRLRVIDLLLRLTGEVKHRHAAQGTRVVFEVEGE